MIDENKRLKVKQFTVSPELFTKGYPADRGPCACTSVCCSGGVYADVKERDIILAHKEMIKEQMDETQVSDERYWFEQEESEDADFVSGRRVGTEVHNNKCVFLDKVGRCSIQLASVQAGKHKWTIKPLFCILFPLEISDNVIGFDDLLQKEQPCCSIDANFEVPMFEACHEELAHLVGNDGLELMRQYYAESQRPVSLPVESKAL